MFLPAIRRHLRGRTRPSTHGSARGTHFRRQAEGAPDASRDVLDRHALHKSPHPRHTHPRIRGPAVVSAPRLARCRGLSSVLASLTPVARRTATNHKRRWHRRGRASIHGSCPSRRRAVQIQKTDHHALQPTRRRDSHAALADRTPARSTQAHGGARQADRQAKQAESGTASRGLERAMLTHTHAYAYS